MRNNFYVTLLLLLMGIGVQSCQKKYLPTDRDAFDLGASFSSMVYRPVLGRTTLFTDNFSDLNSSKPLNFRMLNIRTFDGSAAPELLKPFPATVWIKKYTGKETSLAEIEAKRKTEDHPLFEIRAHSGEFILWSSASSSLLRPMPDSGYVFDVEVSNNGGRKIIEGLKLQPYRERDYEPNNADPVTGNVVNEAVHPLSVSNIIGDSSGITLNAQDIDITFHRASFTGSSLTFKFLDDNNRLIDPARFNLTDWAKLLHGFNMQKTNTYIKYDVAYPIPLVEIPTSYTNGPGTMAHLNFGYERLGFGGIRQVSGLLFDFAIYSKGDWEIVIAFRKETPRFDND
ncbi:DUF5007 domain-containing protein [Niabella beijingensis]|uniref:DUF5007 domain-containing protein n=1 Tax=Niabella beijingensis TaxID=2872700 RepID=UPI001CBC5032|nr:DUF5007 domain-containing protein [Niabella beijingensis]MBZ4188307.1 DUF5007 domain-containing protein [Niabella beijingensis]